MTLSNAVSATAAVNVDVNPAVEKDTPRTLATSVDRAQVSRA